MKLIKIFGNKRKRTVLIIQCRLSSTRLPGKALLPLGDKTVLEWVLAAMKKVPADKYYLACDTDSAEKLEPYAKNAGYDFFAGSKEDVLKRFCDVIELSKADVVIRATADNPFLFYEAASALREEYEKRSGSSPVDYITYTGLPHGSGVEIFNAHSLLEAAAQTSDPYDHEHVGPALYNHKDKFTCEFLHAPKRYYFPELRTTIDTAADYRRAQEAVHFVNSHSTVSGPYTTELIVNAYTSDFVRNPLLLIPCIKKGRGTGHLRRCLKLAIQCCADIYIPEDNDLEQCDSLIEEAKKQGLENYQIIRSLENADAYNLAITDLFNSNGDFFKKLSKKCAVAAFDEGSSDTDCVDYLLDIIPSLDDARSVNYVETSFMPLPEKKKAQKLALNDIKKALVVFGGEDPANLTIPCSLSLKECGLEVTAILDDEEKINREKSDLSGITFIKQVPSLREKLHEYDLVVTHFGFTAYEAVSAGCAVILAATTNLHFDLSKKNNFAVVSKENINSASFRKLLNDEVILCNDKKLEQKDLTQFVTSLSQGKRLKCPVCQKNETENDFLMARTPERTFRRCKSCGMQYMSWTMKAQQTEYNKAYFFEDYQKQYGKTYLEDFESIKSQCVRRVTLIDQLNAHHHSNGSPAILDIGCAMGPFLDAANDAGWQVYGTDISKDAVDYVQNTLHYPAVCSSFPILDSLGEFGIEEFDAITMWYVIEHFQNLNEVLESISKMLKKGGIFAFSTPSASGVSAKYSAQSFYENSPADHFTLWEPAKAAKILKRYGFKVEKIVSTGIHPERLPAIKKMGWNEKSLKFGMAKQASKLLMHGDTFEVYCKKI